MTEGRRRFDPESTALMLSASATRRDRLTHLEVIPERLAQAAPESDRPRRADALRAVHSTFTEGFETPDFIETAQLLVR